MNTKIVEYQKAFSSIKEDLEKNKHVLAVLAYGSMVSGDLWEGSNIDLLVVIDNLINDIKDINLTLNEVPIHLKLISKNNLMNNSNKKIDEILITSRLIICNDLSIRKIHDELRYVPDIEKEKMNLVYLGETLKSINVLNKYLYNNRRYTAFELSLKAMESFAKLYINNNGYLVSKDSINMAISLNDSFKEIVDKIFFEQVNKEEAIKEMITYIKNYLNVNLKQSSRILIDYIKDKDNWVTPQLLKEEELFKGLYINMEVILNELYKNKILNRKILEQSLNGFRYKENVYFYNNI
ncbi:nucleotidyltransferase domain-containing protein [Clostridium intestinale]|jgi:predicted nucleotidyltransferase|uniref:Nucleotidyltransferase domain-containing protein n=2 Tax=Clostridium intestinale TaxID=36845 RepID=U2Q1S4_9CLOT|nr:nucleotidyltransferase domain-containing protein [Clostridium intestinale]ERK29999.1 nucleotidyltransferase domain-containing protein [Clostridium intestinale URNW]QLY78467.1 nucleotidyltransferase domain-containing protein [Clostridium intestinale]